VVRLDFEPKTALFAGFRGLCVHSIMNDAKPQQPAKTRRSGSLLGTVAACVVLVVVLIVFGVKVRSLDAKLTDTQNQLAKAKTDAAQQQTELEKAKSDSTDLQTELNKAKTQQSDLQSQLDQSKDASDQLQTQLDKAKAQSVDLQAQVDKARAQSADLQTQVSQATAGSAQLLTQLDQAKIQSMDLQSRLQKAESDLAQLQPLLLKTRHMPVTTSFEKGHWSSSYTLHVNSLNPQPLTVNITITGSGGTRTQSNVIGVGGTLDVGKLAAADKVAIASDGYDPVAVIVQ
jgi:septal ring factor EnvC (AmiA/AmiB activator)